MMKKALVFILPLLFSLNACKNPHEARIQEIETLLFALDSAKTVLHKMDTGLIFKRNRDCNARINSINRLADTVSRDAVFLIDEYARYQKAYRKAIQKIYPFFEEIEVLPMQLENLKQDLSKNLIDDNQAAQYLKNESVAAITLSQVIFQMDNGLNSIDSAYIVCEEKILHLIERLEALKQENLESTSEHLDI